MKNMVGEMAKNSRRRQREALQNGCPVTKGQISAISANRAKEIAAGADRPESDKPDRKEDESNVIETHLAASQGSKLASMAQFTSIVVNDDEKDET